jgi:hypothetical protein
MNIFAGLSLFGCSEYGHTKVSWLGHELGIAPWWRPWQACPSRHRPSSSAPCAVPMRLSRIGQHIKDEPRAKYPALFDVLSSRFWSISRGHQILCSLFSATPLVLNLLLNLVPADSSFLGKQSRTAEQSSAMLVHVQGITNSRITNVLDRNKTIPF